MLSLALLIMLMIQTISIKVWSAIDVVLSRTLHNRRIFVSRYTFISQTNFCPMSTESQDDHIRSLINNSLGELTSNIAAVVDNRLSEFKRQLEESQNETAETSTDKKNEVDATAFN